MPLILNICSYLCLVEKLPQGREQITVVPFGIVGVRKGEYRGSRAGVKLEKG
jgi:hypothetical protein